MVLVSIVIPVVNGQEYTTQCINSIRRNTKPDQYEIIVIDNCSSAEMKQYLSTLKDDVSVVTSESNEGFAKAINKGFQHAKGEYLFMLNNDTALYSDWLPRMVAAFSEDTGAVGPVSNYVMGRQRISVGRRSATPEQIHNIVSTQAKGQTTETEFLIGFAMMVSRKALEKTGPLDEKFFAGSEDLDYSLRLRRAGFKLKIAQDVFVHHIGSRTSIGVLNKSQEFFDQGNKYFFEKWSKELGTEIGSHRQAFEVALGTKSPDLTISTIVKNECGLAQNMIKVTNAFCDDYCIVDTGSTDDTTSTLRKLLLNNGKVLQHTWADSFSAARNCGLEQARGKWILQLDADEVIDKRYAPLMRQLLSQGQYDAFRFQIVNFRESPFLIADPKKDILTSIRMWKNDKSIRYDGIVHETVSESLVSAKYRVGEAPVPIYHFAYLKPSKRHFKLMKLATEKEPRRSNNHYFLGEEYIKRGLIPKAISCFTNALACAAIKKDGQGYTSKVRQMLDIAKAAVENKSLDQFPKDVKQHFDYLMSQVESE
jgi:GT2 family glycosyltransferase